MQYSKKKLLGFIRTTQNNIHGIQSPLGGKFIRVRSGFIYSREHKFNHIFSDTLNSFNQHALEVHCYSNSCYQFFFYLGFLSRTFTNHRTAGEGGGHFFNFSLPLPPASQTLTHQPGNYFRELTSAHSQQPDSNREPLVSECKSLSTKLRTLGYVSH